MTTDEINNTINANRHNLEVVTDDISDGFHTFGQLYFQRMMLFATLVNLFPEISWKSKRHEDGEECFRGGWFLVTIDTPAGAYGYHYRLEDWDKFNCMELYKAKHWDGYTEDNVDRLFSLVDYKKYMQKLNKDFSGFMLKACEGQKLFDKTTEEQKKICGTCKHEYELTNDPYSKCFFCKRNPDDNRANNWEEAIND